MKMPFDLLLGRKTFEMWARTGRDVRRNGQASIQRPGTSPRIP
jgi:hypothetical protein